MTGAAYSNSMNCALNIVRFSQMAKSSEGGSSGVEEIRSSLQGRYHLQPFAVKYRTRSH